MGALPCFCAAAVAGGRRCGVASVGPRLSVRNRGASNVRPMGRTTARAGLRSKLAALVVRRQAADAPGGVSSSGASPVAAPFRKIFTRIFKNRPPCDK